MHIWGSNLMWTIKAINCLFRLSASLLGNGGRQRCEIFLSLPLFDQSLPSGLKPNHPNLFCVFHSDSAAVTTFWNLVAEAQWTLCLPTLPTLTTSYPPPSLHHHLPPPSSPLFGIEILRCRPATFLATGRTHSRQWGCKVKHQTS